MIRTAKLVSLTTIDKSYPQGKYSTPERNTHLCTKNLIFKISYESNWALATSIIFFPVGENKVEEYVPVAEEHAFYRHTKFSTTKDWI